MLFSGWFFTSYSLSCSFLKGCILFFSIYAYIQLAHMVGKILLFPSLNFIICKLSVVSVIYLHAVKYFRDNRELFFFNLNFQTVFLFSLVADYLLRILMYKQKEIQYPGWTCINWQVDFSSKNNKSPYTQTALTALKNIWKIESQNHLD